MLYLPCPLLSTPLPPPRVRRYAFFAAVDAVVESARADHGTARDRLRVLTLDPRLVGRPPRRLFQPRDVDRTAVQGQTHEPVAAHQNLPRDGRHRRPVARQIAQAYAKTELGWEKELGGRRRRSTRRRVFRDVDGFERRLATRDATAKASAPDAFDELEEVDRDDPLSQYSRSVAPTVEIGVGVGGNTATRDVVLGQDSAARRRLRGS